MLIIDLRAAFLLVGAFVLALLVGAGGGLLGGLVWSARDVAACHVLHEQARTLLTECVTTTQECTCAVTGRCEHRPQATARR